MKTARRNFFPSLTFSSLLLTFLTLFAGSVASAQIPSSGLVGYWPFSGNANDESGNGNNGTVNGATLTTDRFGNANSAYSFNGAGNLISLLGGSNIQGNNPRSISFWANMPIGITNTHTVYKGGVNGSGNDFTIWLVVLSNNTYRLQVRRYENDPETIQMPVLANQWINFCVTYDGTINSNVKIYINGVQQPGVSTSGGDNLIYNTISTTPEFGHMVDQLGVHRYMNGKLDDISIYNRALTPAEITQLYTDQTSLVEVPCTSFLGEDQTVCAGTSVTLSAIDTLNVYNGPSFLRFIGGAGEDQIRSLVKDENGDLYVYGYTGSADFPVTIDAYQNTLRGQSDLFLTKLDGQGNIIWSTFIGGDGSENIGYNEQSLALDSQGNIIIGGLSSSSNFPTTTGAFQTNYNLNTDCVLAKFSSSGALIWSSYYGGSQGESINQIVVDSNDNIYITGYSYSFNFPTSSGAFQTTGSNNPSNNCDMFLVKFDFKFG